MSYFIPHASAQATSAVTTTPTGAPGVVEQPPAWMNFVPLILILFVFYFLMMRPQQKRYKAHIEMQNSIDKGDEIITSGGVIGTVKKVQEDGILHVEIAENTVVKIQRSGVASRKESV